MWLKPGTSMDQEYTYLQRVPNIFAGTLAPAREIPGDGSQGGGGSGNSFENSVMYFLTNVNLIVPVVAAVAVIVIAIAVICVLRHNRHPLPVYKGNSIQIYILFCQTFRTDWRGQFWYRS